MLVERLSGHEAGLSPVNVDTRLGTLVVCPMSVLNNWESQLAEHVKEGALDVRKRERERDLGDFLEQLLTWKGETNRTQHPPFFFCNSCAWNYVLAVYTTSCFVCGLTMDQPMKRSNFGLFVVCCELVVGGCRLSVCNWHCPAFFGSSIFFPWSVAWRRRVHVQNTDHGCMYNMSSCLLVCYFFFIDYRYA